MSFCAKCGRERSDDARYCGGCGTEYAAAPEAAVEAQAASASPQAGEPARWEPPADATRVDRQPDATMVDRPGSGSAGANAPTEPDPFAGWFAPDAPPAPRTEPGGQWRSPEPWQAADTVYAGAGQRAPAVPSPSQQAPGYPPPRPPYGAQPGPPPGGRRSSGGRKAALILVVALVMLAAGGGAYALVARSGKHNTAAPPASPTIASSAPATGQTSATASGSSAGSPAADASASASASGSASSSPTSSLVSVAPGVASGGAEPAVEKTLTRYFDGINTHNYDEYQSAHNAQQQATMSQSDFNSGYQSTSDSAITLVTLDPTAAGQSATVTFTSHQAAGTGIDGSACNHWQLTFFMVPQGSGYVIGAPPSGYKPVYSDC